MNLLFVHERFGALAGAEANIRQTAAELKRRGHTVGLLHGPATGKAEAEWRLAFAARFALPANDGQFTVQAACQHFKPDLIYVHKLANLPVLEALLAEEAPRVRMVHDHELYCMRSYKYHYFSREICTRPASPYCLFPCWAFLGRNHDGGLPVKWVSYPAKKKEIALNRRFDRLVVATDYMKEELLRNGFAPEKIEIHPPVPCLGDGSVCPSSVAELRSVNSSFSQRNLVVYAGQVTRGKGVDILLESLALVQVPFECFIFGDGNHRPFCQKLCRELGLEARVHFKGFVPQEELKHYYREASVAVLSSVWPEPFGATGLEAMRYGVPVVAFDAGGIREWLSDGHNGFLAPWMNRAGLAARVELLLRDKDLARLMGQRGLRLVNERFGFSDYITGLENMFARLVEEVRSVKGEVRGPFGAPPLPPSPARSRAREEVAA